MTFDSIDANGIILIILGVFAILGFLKILVRLFFNLIALATGVVAGLWGYNNGFSLAKKVVEEPEAWMSIAISVVAFFGAFFIVKMILGLLSGKSSEDGQVRTMGFGLPGGIFGLLFGGVIIYCLLTGVRYAGTVAELEQFKDYLGGKVEEGRKQPLFIDLKNWIDSSLLGQWHQKVDFFNSQEQAELAKLAIVNKNPEGLQKVAPEISEAEIPEALPVDQSIQDSIQQGDYGAVLRNPALREKARNLTPEQQALLELVEQKLKEFSK